MPVQSGEITNILLLLQGQHQCVLVALAKTVSQFTHNCTHIHPAPAHRVRYLHSLVLPCEAGTIFTYSCHLWTVSILIEEHCCKVQHKPQNKQPQKLFILPLWISHIYTHLHHNRKVSKWSKFNYSDSTKLYYMLSKLCYSTLLNTVLPVLLQVPFSWNSP